MRLSKRRWLRAQTLGYVWPMPVIPWLAELSERLVSAVERAEVLDAPAEAVDKAVAWVRPGAVKDLLSGVPGGHPLHPALVAVPIGSFVGATYLDAVGGDPAAARRLLGLGLASSVPTALTGLSDWSDTRGAERRVGLVHLVVNVTGLGLLTASWLARARGQRTAGAVASGLAGLTVIGVGGWLGGHLAYALGVGVDTTAFLRPPTEWVYAVAEHELVEGKPVAVTIENTPVLLVRQDGRISAIGDRCSHRGAPLHEGPVVDGCVECPWHGSRFDLTDGSVVRGPATRPAASFETRVVDGQVQVRRDEARTLRLNPTG